MCLIVCEFVIYHLRFDCPGLMFRASHMHFHRLVLLLWFEFHAAQLPSYQTDFPLAISASLSHVLLPFCRLLCTGIDQDNIPRMTYRKQPILPVTDHDTSLRLIRVLHKEIKKLAPQAHLEAQLMNATVTNNWS